jgi:hypothetical protein
MTTTALPDLEYHRHHVRRRRTYEGTALYNMNDLTRIISMETTGGEPLRVDGPKAVTAEDGERYTTIDGIRRMFENRKGCDCLRDMLSLQRIIDRYSNTVIVDAINDLKNLYANGAHPC